MNLTYGHKVKRAANAFFFLEDWDGVADALREDGIEGSELFLVMKGAQLFHKYFNDGEADGSEHGGED